MYGFLKDSFKKLTGHDRVNADKHNVLTYDAIGELVRLSASKFLDYFNKDPPHDFLQLNIQNVYVNSMSNYV